MRVISDPYAVDALENTYSVIDTLMSIRQDSPALSPTDFPNRYRKIFNERRCAFLSSATGRAALAPWQARKQESWANMQQDNIAIRTAKWAPSTETRWIRSLLSSATASSTTWTTGVATPDAVAVHMDTLHAFYATALESIYKAQLAELEKPASVSLEK